MGLPKGRCFGKSAFVGGALANGKEPLKEIPVSVTAHLDSNEKYGPGMKFARSGLKIPFLAGSSIFILTRSGQAHFAKSFLIKWSKSDRKEIFIKQS